MNDIEKQIKRVIGWNKARYEQEFDSGLSLALLSEEVEELSMAEELSDRLDAIGDITFVTIGIMWKLGISTQRIVSFFEANSSLTSLFRAADNIDKFIAELTLFDELEQSVLKTALYATFSVCILNLGKLGMQHTFITILSIICDSNDTKSLPKTKVDASKKANIDKGELFVPPTKALMKLIVGEY